MTTYLSQSQVAALAGITARRIRQMHTEGIAPPKCPEGYRVDDVQAWLEHRWAQQVTAGNLSDERARLIHHQANLAALEEAAKRQNLIPAETARAKWGEMRHTATARLARLVRDLCAVHGLAPAGIEAKARELVYAALEDLARGPQPDGAGR